ncbi:hypothetical protein CFC21_051661 [Triticum aestivum]|uniref:IST1-like protein n=4 Tax=Triticum TaxID=4564 RepID=A0A9R0S589_TRITD|nr:uncharacterized protein LOC119285163 [Triticum dicoccoides]XP_044362894.1 uncharacterized protein LOC123085331 [Triticum aestivum]XP_048571813.1 uncharacterized protein LOC125552348 [Triticum urartu]KAF7041945.1 hypothetical protein CFC21_051661 [Triticum aestivum]VAH88990.1 unnamed protein product [Triticum turgidum subsp. durum]
MGFFTRSTSKQTAKLKSLVKLAVARLAVVRRPRLGRRSIARGDVAQLLSIGHLDRALARAEQVMEEDSVLEALDIIEHYCKVLVEHSAQLEKPKECGEDIKAAAAGLIFASARCGELPELLDARAILASKFGREFERAAKEGSQAVVNPTLVQRLSGEKASAEQQRRLAREIAAENGILLDFPDGPGEVHQSKQNEQPKKVPAPVPAEKPVEQLEVKTETSEAQRRQRLADDDMSRSNLARQRAEEKASRESKKYDDVRMAAEAAFESASFAAMAARAAVELSRTESQGKGPRGGGRGHDKVHPLQSSGATERETRPPGRPQKPPSPSPSPSWSDKSTVSSVWSDAPARDPPSPPKGKSIVFDRSDGEDDDVVEDLVWTPQLRRPPHNRRTASAMGMDGVGGNGNTRAEFQDSVPNGSGEARPAHRRHAGGGARREAPEQAGQYRAPPYRRSPAAGAGGNAEAYESSAFVARAPYARITSALEGGNEHIARHEEVRRMGTDARVLQEQVYGAAAPGPGRAPLTPDRRAISVRTRR